jgi:hypothetical protein
MGRDEVVYEVNLRLDPSIGAEFDVWLEHHVREMVRLPGFLGATIHRVEDPGSGELQRTTHYRLSSRSALEDYFRNHAERMRADGVRRFGDRFTATRRILDAGHELGAADQGVACANCDAALRGQYCANCGQRARDRMISVWELVKEASEILTSLDSRLWRTLGMLLFRPGRMTSDYLLGRRARYIPALRLFLGLSLIFFFLFSIDASFNVNGGDGESDELNLQIQLGDDESDGTVIHQPPDDEAHALEFRLGNGAPSDPGRQQPAKTGGQDPANEPAPGEPETTAPDDDADMDHSDNCEDIEVNWPESLSFMERWLSTERVTAACEKIVADHGASFGRALLENIPLMMFMFLPLMAFLMKFFYPLTGRYYVEHLLFLVHYHSFFYLLVGMGIVLDWVLIGGGAAETAGTLIFAGFAIYIPVYLFRAMRVVYGQGTLATAFKYVLLGIAYLISLALMLTITVTVTAVTL